MRLVLTIAIAGLLGACAATPRAQPWEVIHIVLPNPGQTAGCEAGTEGYRRDGMSCFGGVQIHGAPEQHGLGRKGTAPTVTAQTAAGLPVRFHADLFAGWASEDDQGGSVSGYFEVHGCDRPASMRVSTESPGAVVDLRHSAMVGPGRHSSGERMPSFVYGWVNIGGEALLNEQDSIQLRFEGRPQNCRAVLTLPQSHLSAIRQWSAAAIADERARRQELMQ